MHAVIRLLDEIDGHTPVAFQTRHEWLAVSKALTRYERHR